MGAGKSSFADQPSDLSTSLIQTMHLDEHVLQISTSKPEWIRNK
jgi:hypothetical protein